MLPKVEKVQVGRGTDAVVPRAGEQAEASGGAAALPDWLPDPVRHYLRHVEGGLSFRAIARAEGRAASTVMRQIRRFENRREDPLWDEALAALGRRARPCEPGKDDPDMSAPLRAARDLMEEATFAAEARRILRRLTETGAMLAIAPDMEKAVVLRTLADGNTARTAVLDRSVAQGFVLRDWITCRKAGRIAAYEITPAGRTALRRMLEEDARGGADAAPGLAEAAAPFADRHRVWGERTVAEADGPRRVRYNIAESPVMLLARRRERDGKPFLDAGLVAAAERLREDFELAQMGPRVAQNWERFLTAGDRGGFRSEAGRAEGPKDARDRVAAALRELGPGLGDVALRCCCFLEGLEVAEKRMGWAARSGKVVLRIALSRLRRHYDETYGRSGPMIG